MRHAIGTSKISLLTKSRSTKPLHGIKKKIVQNFDLGCLYTAEKTRDFFTHILYKREKKHAVDCFPGTS